MPRCLECESPATNQRRCKSHWEAYRARPGVKARERRRDALRAGSDAAAQLRKKLREDIKRDVWPVCARCKGKFLPSQVDIDHVVALKDGGEDVPENLQILCRDLCHRIKTATDMGYPPF